MTGKQIRVAAAVAATGVVMWIVAGVWHDLIMASLYENTHASHQGLGLLLIAYFVLATLMVALYPAFRWSSRRVVNGLLFGAVVGLLWVLPHGLAMAGAHGSSLVYVLKNSAWHMVEQGIGGLVLALLYPRSVSRPSPSHSASQERVTK